LVFFQKKNLPLTPLSRIKVATGFVKLSTPEATALDLIQYYKVAGHWGLISTVMVELAPLLNAPALAQAAEQGQYELATLQRTGYLLESLGFQEKTEELNIWLNQSWAFKKRKKSIAWRPDQPIKCSDIKNSKWQIWANDKIEVDDL
jgi:hypothetical protein